MNDAIPESKWKRTMVGGKTAANVSGKVLKYLVKKPFLNPAEQGDAKQNLERDYANEIFKGLVLLKGTALKIAQLLSFELDLIPETVRKELEKSYNQVPPINRALVRKMILNSYGDAPEDVFSEFDYSAFAAASLGQVHKATDKEGRQLAVKIQYPGIGKTIKNDLQIVRNLARPTPYYRFVMPVLEEIELRLMEEIDYFQEAENTRLFHNNLKEENVVVPEVFSELSTRTVLTTEYIPGKSLDQWIAEEPGQEDRDYVASILYKQFFKSLFSMKCVHADPNPGNFIVMENLDIGLVDFGCVKHFSHDFVRLFVETSRTMIDGDKEQYFEHMKKMNVLHSTIDSKTADKIYKILKKSSEWFCRIYESDSFDFGKHPDFILEGKQIMQETHQYRKYFKPNPEFVFLNRTHYGLIRIFEKLKAKVHFVNPYQWQVT